MTTPTGRQTKSPKNTRSPKRAQSHNSSKSSSRSSRGPSSTSRIWPGTSRKDRDMQQCLRIQARSTLGSTWGERREPNRDQPGGGDRAWDGPLGNERRPHPQKELQPEGSSGGQEKRHCKASRREEALLGQKSLWRKEEVTPCDNMCTMTLPCIRHHCFIMLYLKEMLGKRGSLRLLLG
jgi:hypothetical protein